MSSFTRPDILRPNLATLLTPLATSAYFEQFKTHSDVPVKSRAHHLHFTWDETTLRRDTSNLEELYAGEWRYSREGVQYRQINIEDPRLFKWFVDGGQFQYVAMGVVDYKDGFKIAMRDKMFFPDGALYSTGLDSRGWVKNPTGYTIARCKKHGGKVALGKPTLPPEHWVNTIDHHIGRFVLKSARNISQKLTGKRRDTER